MNARREYKYSLNYRDYIILRDRLPHIMRRDPHADANGEYRVRSLYFDTARDKVLLEKINGVDNRVKYRLRRYVGSEGLVKLERKSKFRGLCEKRSAELTIAETKAILRGDIDWALSDGRSLVAELYAKIKEGFFPKTIVEYTREAFTFDAGNARVTLDKDIRGGLYSVGFFDSIPLIRAGDEIALLEVKFDQFIPDHIARALRICDRRPSACSKYALCRLYG